VLKALAGIRALFLRLLAGGVAGAGAVVLRCEADLRAGAGNGGEGGAEGPG
jgi:hypothetical protein